MKHKTADLEGALLDAAVAKAEGYMKHGLQEWEGRQAWGPRGVAWPEKWLWVDEWHPSIDWSVAGPIIERERITLMLETEAGPWYACADPSAGRTSRGPTPLIAAMRAYVASRLGEEVEL